MKKSLIAMILCASWLSITAQDIVKPIVGSDLVFGEKDGLIVVEAEYFYKQTKNEKRAWYLNSPQHNPMVMPDFDTASYLDAGGLAYVEALPDLFHSDNDEIIVGDNLGITGGSMAVLHYKVYFNKPGKYYLWTRLRSNDQEDNTTAAGFDGIWPVATQTLQSPVESKKWEWRSDNRLSRTPWKIGRAAFNIPTAGLHEIQYCMREDGEEFDRFILTADSLYTIAGETGPSATVKEGKLPQPFSADKIKPLVKRGIANPDGSVYGANVVYEDTLGMVSFEAENFYRQKLTHSRMWHLVTKEHTPLAGPDSDSPHLTNASGDAYLELLPDGRQKDEDEINNKTSIYGVGGQGAITGYMVYFTAPGRYYVWVRAFAVDGDDNTLHCGIDTIWPESGKKITFSGQEWKWTNTQRDTKASIYLDVTSAGIHEVKFSMREDGCEIDRIFLCTNKDFVPSDNVILPSKIRKGVMQDWYNVRNERMNTAGYFLPVENTVIIETESVPSSAGWKYYADTTGHTGYGYYEWSKEGQGIKPGEGLLKYNFEITEPGEYQMLIRGKIKDPSNRPETSDPDGNDIWVKFSDGSNKGTMAKSEESWTKVAILGHPNGWNWNTNADIEKSHPISPVVRNFGKGVYTVELSGRSMGYAIDRIAIIKIGKDKIKDFTSPAVNKLTGLSESPYRRY